MNDRGPVVGVPAPYRPLPDRRESVHGGCVRAVHGAHAPARGDMARARRRRCGVHERTGRV